MMYRQTEIKQLLAEVVSKPHPSLPCSKASCHKTTTAAGAGDEDNDRSMKGTLLSLGCPLASLHGQIVSSWHISYSYHYPVSLSVCGTATDQWSIYK